MNNFALIRSFMLAANIAFLAVLSACSGMPEATNAEASGTEASPFYVIGPRDSLQIFVWRNPELTTSVIVRPDGKVTVPLIEDLQAAGKTPTELAREIEKQLEQFVQSPVVSVIMNGFVGPYDQQIRVIGEATNPQAIPFNEKMTALDVMIAVGGLTEFAAGNRAVLVRQGQGSFRVRLDDLIKDGDVSANVPVMPGDVLIVPQSWF
ncbi:MAG: polysaccharide biosynthesis/export protein [Alphaproteobacteria bacterium]|nr:polysaccharide biosynthesis/export protein [Alphaproteobacteria bacterium]